jgi:hypothetical protein
MFSDSNEMKSNIKPVYEIMSEVENSSTSSVITYLITHIILNHILRNPLYDPYDSETKEHLASECITLAIKLPIPLTDLNNQESIKNLEDYVIKNMFHSLLTLAASKINSLQQKAKSEDQIQDVDIVPVETAQNPQLDIETKDIEKKINAEIDKICEELTQMLLNSDSYRVNYNKNRPLISLKIDQRKYLNNNIKELNQLNKLKGNVHFRIDTVKELLGLDSIINFVNQSFKDILPDLRHIYKTLNKFLRMKPPRISMTRHELAIKYLSAYFELSKDTDLENNLEKKQQWRDQWEEKYKTCLEELEKKYPDLLTKSEPESLLDICESNTEVNQDIEINKIYEEVTQMLLSSDSYEVVYVHKNNRKLICLKTDQRKYLSNNIKKLNQLNKLKRNIHFHRDVSKKSLRLSSIISFVEKSLDHVLLDSSCNSYNAVNIFLQESYRLNIKSHKLAIKYLSAYFELSKDTDLENNLEKKQQWSDQWEEKYKTCLQELEKRYPKPLTKAESLPGIHKSNTEENQDIEIDKTYEEITQMLLDLDSYIFERTARGQICRAKLKDENLQKLQSTIHEVNEKKLVNVYTIDKRNYLTYHILKFIKTKHRDIMREDNLSKTAIDNYLCGSYNVTQSTVPKVIKYLSIYLEVPAKMSLEKKQQWNTQWEEKRAKFLEDINSK